MNKQHVLESERTNLSRGADEKIFFPIHLFLIYIFSSLQGRIAEYKLRARAESRF